MDSFRYLLMLHWSYFHWNIWRLFPIGGRICIVVAACEYLRLLLHSDHWPIRLFFILVHYRMAIHAGKKLQKLGQRWLIFQNRQTDTSCLSVIGVNHMEFTFFGFKAEKQQKTSKTSPCPCPCHCLSLCNVSKIDQFISWDYPFKYKNTIWFLPG